MAVDIQDIKNVAEEIKGSFDEFKLKNDKRLEAVEQEKGKLSEQVEALNGKLSELDKLKSGLEAELKELKRPGRTGGGSDQAQKEHKEAFRRFITKGDESGLEELERKALNSGSDEDGGRAIPLDINRQIDDLARDAVTMRQVCRVISTGTPSYKELVNVHGAGSGWVGETDKRPETNTPKLQEVEPVWGEVYANPQATQRILDDSFFNMESWLSSELQGEFSEQEEETFTSGNGSKKPKGFLAYPMAATADKTRAFGTLQTISSAAAGTVSADELMKLIYTLRKPYRAGALYMMNNNSLFQVRTLKDSQGNYIWQPGLASGQPSTILGYGIAENEAMPDLSSGTTGVAFGNFQRGYTIVDRIGIRMLRDPYTNKPYVGFYTTKRVGGFLKNSEAIKILKQKS
ncbi:phage major capsid protein [Endozoicomonas sp. Mp262]|uniref:phage major capsid protein n=1 Tax=Endozoicomonas sp. Mp262 TaxID=2919499 RepID=UPI0021D84B94